MDRERFETGLAKRKATLGAEYVVARDFTRLERLEPIRSSGSPADR